jgi:phosphoglycerol transferase MdoB-like AlkP superfamily enzyme
MFRRLIFLLFYWLTWVLFFQIARAIFLIYHLSHTRELPVRTSLLTFVYGGRMDLSMAAYLLAPVCLFVLVSVMVPFFRRPILYKVYSYILLFFVLLICVADLEVYEAWGSRMDATPLKYLASPREVWASISHLPVFFILFLFVVIYIGLCLVFGRVIERICVYLYSERRGWVPVLVSAFTVLLFTALLIIPMRGGLQLAPINQSSVYFSSSNFANLAAINAPWNFVHGLSNRTSATENPYVYLEPVQAKGVVDSLLSQSGVYEKVLNTDTPNVVFIVWESFTDKATHLNVGGKEVTPGFNALKKEGIYFSRVYASGDRTDKGIAAVLSGYPALPNTAIIRTPVKASRLGYIGKMFKDRGYATSFYYGGETEFANIKSYVLSAGFDALTDVGSFSAKDKNSKWGAHDGVVAAKLMKDLQTMRQPFFTTWLTLSSHEPYETPVEPVFKGDDRDIKFLNSIHYTDAVVYDFIQKCKQQPWWNKTLLVIVADHGHSLPETHKRTDDFTIPMLWLGGALSQSGGVVDKVVSQLDIASTLAQQIGEKKPLFPFSRNIFDSSYKQWAFFTFNNGFGLVQPDKAFVFDNVGKQVILNHGAVGEPDLKVGKALQQMTYQDYLDK